ncbi:MAG: acylneuraminate cytidylyltransferase family protein [Bacteroidota bacterium]|nr:acylneuraminate cytidylyltransferase family protein [Bacteroidota bacterium]
MENCIAVIPARSGSKGLINKNIRLLNGVPLLAHSINVAIDSKMFKKIFVSTDSEDYAKIAVKYGADASFLRSKELSTDDAGSWDVVREVIRIFNDRGEFFDSIMLLQPTSPLRISDDIIRCFELMSEKQANSVISVCEMDHSPLWSNTLPDNLSMAHFRREEYSDLPRQALPKFYRINGAIYLLKTEELYTNKMFREKSYAYIMPQERSIDIDTDYDFTIAEVLMGLRNAKKEG